MTSTNEALGPFNYKYVATAGTNNVIKNAPGFLKSIIVGTAVASAVIEVSDHASDGNGNVKIHLEDDALGPAVYDVSCEFDTGICADLTNQTNVTFVFK